MKKILLGTTTLVGAVALFAGAALAETPKITLGGFADFQIGVINEDETAGIGNTNTRSHAFKSDTELSFRIDGKTDSGLGYGGAINLEADTTADADNQGLNASKTFIYVDGGWGRVEMGSNVGVDGTMKVDAASIARATGGIDGDFSYYASSAAQFLATPDLNLGYGTGNLGNEEKENLNKVTYYTPRFAGLQVGVSYAVNSTDRGQTINRTDNNAGEADRIWLGGINYDNKFGDIGVNLAATGEYGDSESVLREDLRTWNVGGKLSYMGFSVAGSYGDLGESLRVKTLNADESNYWTAGAAYEYGPFAASVTYLSSEYDLGGVAGSNDFTNLSVGADYKLAPGLTPYAEVNFFEMDVPGSGVATADNEGTVFIAGTQLNF